MSTTEDEIRQDLSVALRQEVTDDLWNYLIDMGFVQDVIEDAADINSLADDARKIIIAGGGQPLGRKPQQMVSKAEEHRDRDTWTLRDVAISKLLARDAGKDLEVQSFRDEVLDGTLLSESAVAGWMQEQAKDSDPHLGHFSDFLGSLRKMLEYSAPDSEYLRVQSIGDSGVLMRLSDLSQHLIALYPWKADQATSFILTGSPPLVLAIEADLAHSDIPGDLPSASTRIVMKIDPAVPPKDVAEHYQSLRKTLVLKRPRSMGARHLWLAAFMAEQQDDTWDHSMKVWNKAWSEKQPEWRYSQLSNFIRDAVKARKALLYPEYRLARGPERWRTSAQDNDREDADG